VSARPCAALALGLALLLAALPNAAPVARAATVRVQPDTVWIERGRGLQRIHCDFRFDHDGADTLTLERVTVAAFDVAGRLIARRFIGSNGTAPAILTLPRREVARGRPLLVFNPFPEWDEALPIARLRYRFELSSEARAETLRLDVAPQEFKQRTDLILPIAGRLIVFDGHDALAHHRRFDTSFEPVARLGLTRNPGRYACDLSIVDERGSMWRTDGRSHADWWSWDAPLRAPGAGRVVVAINDRPDYEVGGPDLPMADTEADPYSLAGNCVVIDHGRGEFSLIAHLQKGSVLVKPGERVTQGQPIGRVGYSGSVFTVHVHYELRTGAILNAEGLPSRFGGVDRWVGGQRVPVRDGFIDTGDILESR